MDGSGLTLRLGSTLKVWTLTAILGITHLEAHQLLVCAQHTLTSDSKRGTL